MTPRFSASVPGRTIVSASDMNRRDEHLRRLSRFQVTAPLAMLRTSCGDRVRLAETAGFWARIVSGSNPYEWIELIPDAAGTWLDGPRRGDPSAAPAYEVHARSDVPPETIVWMEPSRDVGMDYRFQVGGCS